MFIPVDDNIVAGWDVIGRAVEEKDGKLIREKVREIEVCGASALNVSGAMSDGDEFEALCRLLSNICEVSELPVSLDSAEPGILEAATEHYLEKSGKNIPETTVGDGVPWLIYNSITAEKRKYDGVLPLIHKYRASVIALTLDGGGMPVGAQKRVEIAMELVGRLREDGIGEERIFVDPLVMPTAVDTRHGVSIIEAVRKIRETYRGIHITCGLSNVSHGLPSRRILNRTFLAMLAAVGLDSAILDTTDKLLMGTIAAAQALAGNDPYCAEYIAAYRSGKFDF